MNIRFDILVEYAPFFFQGALLTIVLSLMGVFFGTVLGLLIGIGKMSKIWLSIPLKIYVTFFRGTPLLVQILLIHFAVVPTITGQTNGLLAAIISLSLNSAAYVAEIFRAGIQSIDKGQFEGAYSLGMSRLQTMRFIILPQAFKRMIPPLGNEFIVLIKDSSLVAIIAVEELMYWGRAMSAQYTDVWTAYLSAAFIYLLLTFTAELILNRLEKRLKTA
ncbi:amino acid ABC transporter permease [Bacillaceae bacterium Marseille-Q3522]|nr:amino acid ABC transporter permease [Bacillaceae bacterium Marseille-Q3522]